MGENGVCLGGIFNQTDWIEKEKAFEQRREWILEEARKYDFSKKVL